MTPCNLKYKWVAKNNEINTTTQIDKLVITLRTYCEYFVKFFCIVPYTEELANYETMNHTSSDYLIKQLCNICKMSAIFSQFNVNF